MSMKVLTLNDVEESLKNYVSIVPRREILSFEDVKEFTNKYDFPVAIKGYSSKYFHKTEKGLVEINVCGLKKVEEIYKEMIKKAERVYIEKQIKGREVFTGIKKDVSFGEVVFFGRGGIDVEIEKDISFRVLPTSINDLRDMILSTKIGKNLVNGKYRDITVKLDLIADFIRSLIDFYENNKFYEMEINPAIITYENIYVVDFRAIVL